MKAPKIPKTHKRRAKKRRDPAEAPKAKPVDKGSTQRVFGSMAAAAAALNVPVHVLKKLKRDGTPGFHCSGRVDIDQLTPHLRDAQGVAGVAEDQAYALECRRLLAQCERIEFANEVARQEYVHVATYAEKHLRFGSRVNLVFKLRRNLVPVELRSHWDDLHTEVMKELRAAYGEEIAGVATEAYVDKVSTSLTVSPTN